MTLVKHPTEDVLAGNVNHSMTLYQINRPGRLLLLPIYTSGVLVH